MGAGRVAATQAALGDPADDVVMPVGPPRKERSMSATTASGQNARPALFVVRFAGELATKSNRTRSAFARALRRNIRDALARAGIRGRLVQSQGRLFVFADDAALARAQLARVFGIGTFSPVAARVQATLDAMAAAAETHFAELIRGRRYAVRARRRGHHAFRSLDVERHVGRVLNAYGTVDLTNPEVTVHVEILEHRAFLAAERLQGAGGLPLGTGGQALVLLSGGFDSAVAAWQMMRRGVAVDFLFCNLAGAAYERQVVQVAKVLTDLWAFGTRPKLFVVDFNPVVAELRARVDQRLWQVVLKRLMYRAASRIARRVRAPAIVTGEAIGQVSSQTLSNLAAIEPGADRLVLRPLIAQDKRDIIQQARRIGTAVLSERIAEFCALTDRAPAVASTPAQVDAEEAKLDPAVLAAAVEGARRIDLAGVDARELRSDYLFVDQVPEGAQVIDIRDPRLFARWHLPGAVNLSPEDVLASVRRLDKRRPYVVFCSFGTISAHLAELMQQLGYQAYALRGREAEIRRRLEEAEIDG